MTSVTCSANGESCAFICHSLEVCDMELETYDNVALSRSTPEGTLEANVPWRPSSAANTNERRLEIKFTPPIAVRSLIAEQDEDFEFILFYRSPGATYDTYVRSANNQLMVSPACS